MQNNPKVIEKAKRQLRKYRIWSNVAIIIGAICAGAIVYSGHFSSLIVAIIVGLIASILLGVLTRRIISKKYIMDVINKELDAETFLNIIQLGKFVDPLDWYQLQGEYFCGHYQNVVGICKAKMADPKIAKRNMGLYLAYLANVYFDTGDDENLRHICDRYSSFLAAEKPRTRSKYIKDYKGMTFYEYYLKGDIKSCTEFLNKPVSTILEKYIYAFRRARLAHIQGNVDEARRCHESLSREVPQLNIGRLSAAALAKMEEQPAAPDIKLMDIPEESITVPLYTAKRNKVLPVLCVCMAVFLLIIGIAVDLQSLEYKKEYERAVESVRLLVEEEYDNVTVFDVFYLTKEDEIIDFMFICEADTQILVGCMYVRDGDSKDYDQKSISLSAELLSERHFNFLKISFQSVTSYNQIEIYFYGNKSDVPPEYYHLSAFEVDGKEVYFVVTEIMPLSTTTEPEISA